MSYAVHIFPLVCHYDLATDTLRLHFPFRTFLQLRDGSAAHLALKTVCNDLGNVSHPPGLVRIMCAAIYRSRLFLNYLHN